MTNWPQMQEELGRIRDAIAISNDRLARIEGKMEIRCENHENHIEDMYKRLSSLEQDRDKAYGAKAVVTLIAGVVGALAMMMLNYLIKSIGQ